MLLLKMNIRDMMLSSIFFQSVTIRAITINKEFKLLIARQYRSSFNQHFHMIGKTNGAHVDNLVTAITIQILIGAWISHLISIELS